MIQFLKQESLVSQVKKHVQLQCVLKIKELQTRQLNKEDYPQSLQPHDQLLECSHELS